MAASHLPMSKRVAVSMSEDDAALFKEYCSFFKISQSDALHLFAKAAMNQHALHCKKVESIFELRQKDLDKRSDKICFGWPCLSCAHTARCTAGLYEGKFEVHDRCKHLFLQGPMAQTLKLLNEQEPEA